MYLRHATVRRGGKTHTYWRLVRSVRIGRKVRQETVAPRGELDAQGQLAARAWPIASWASNVSPVCSTTICVA